MRAIEFITEAEVDNSRRGFLKTLGKAAGAAAVASAVPGLAFGANDSFDDYAREAIIYNTKNAAYNLGMLSGVWMADSNAVDRALKKNPLLNKAYGIYLAYAKSGQSGPYAEAGYSGAKNLLKANPPGVIVQAAVDGLNEVFNQSRFNSWKDGRNSPPPQQQQQRAPQQQQPQQQAPQQIIWYVYIPGLDNAQTQEITNNANQNQIPNTLLTVDGVRDVFSIGPYENQEQAQAILDSIKEGFPRADLARVRK